MGCLGGRFLQDFRSRSCFCLNSYRSCDTCLIMKTLPFAECTVSDYTFLSQASNEQGKAQTSMAIVPHDFFAGTRNGRKWWRVRRQGLGTFSGPETEEGTSTIEKLQRSIKMKGTSTVELQMELQKVCFAKKRCCKRFFFALIGKDIQKGFT